MEKAEAWGEYSDEAGGNFWRGLASQSRVLRALMIRQLMMRYGRGNIGFLWIVLEPMILCAGVIGLRWLIQAHEEHGIPLVSMLLSGYMPLTLWRHLTNGGLFLFRRNIGLFYHRDVSLFDALGATFALEFAGCTVAFIVNYSVLLEIGVVGPIGDYGLVASGWILMGIISASVATGIAVLSEYYEASERFIQPLQYLFVPLSGFFFMTDWLPSYAQSIVFYMPSVHCYEIIRDGFFGKSVVTHYAIWYPLAFSLVLLAITVPKINSVRDKLHAG